MKSFGSKICFLLLGLTLLAGCGTNLRLSELSEQIVALKPGDGTTVKLTVQYVNQTVVPVAISTIDHRLFVNGTLIGEIKSPDAVGLPSMNSASETVNLRLANPAALEKLRSLASTGSATYRLESNLLVEVEDSKDRVKIGATGNLDLSAFK